MKLSTRSRYGTRMLLDIAMNGTDGPVRIKDISERQGVSVKYLEKLIRPLKQAEIVTSKRGPKGGHVLNKAPSEISIGELVRLFEDDVALTQCVKEPDVCTLSVDCITRQIWIEAGQAMIEKLSSVSLADLMRDAEKTGMNPAKCLPEKVPARFPE